MAYVGFYENEHKLFTLSYFFLISYIYQPTYSQLSAEEHISLNPTSNSNENDTTPTTPILDCISTDNKEFSFVLSTHRNSSGHWLAEMQVVPGSWEFITGRQTQNPFEVQLHHRTKTCTKCADLDPESLRVTLHEPAAARVPHASGYRYFPGFGFYKRHTRPRRWLDARATCEEEGADLVVINSQAEALLLLELSAPLLFLQPADNWNAEAFVGVSDYHHEGLFVTVDGLPLNETGYVHWSPGEPNNHREEDCVTIVRNAMFNDVECSKTFEFICEIAE